MPDLGDLGVDFGVRGLARLPRKPGATTPPFLPSGGYGNDLPESPSLSADPNSGMTAADQQYLDLISHPPQKATGVRGVLGNIASTVGPLLGGPAVAQVGQRLLYPGADAWQANVARAQAASAISDKALDRQTRIENLQSLRDQRKQSAMNQQEGRYEQATKGMLPIDALPSTPGSLQSPEMFRQGQDNMANVGLPQTRTQITDALPEWTPSASPMAAPMTQTGPAPPPTINRVQGTGTQLGAQIEPQSGLPIAQAGTVQQVPKPGGGTEPWLRPSAAATQTIAANKEKATRAAAKEADQGNWITATDEMAADPQLKAFGVVAGEPVNPTIAQAYLTSQFRADKTPPVDQQVLNAAVRSVAAKHGLELNPSQPLMEQLPVEYQSEAAQEHKRLNALPPSSLDTALKQALLNQRMSGSDASSNARADKSYQYNSGRLDKLQTPIDATAQRISRLQDTIAQGNMTADALVAPELLSVMAGGMGSGLRMNEAEISRIVGGRTNWESLKAAAQKWNTDPNSARSITPAQQQQIHALVQTVATKISAKQQALDDARQGLINTTDVAEHRKITTNAMSRLSSIDRGEAQAVTTGSQPAGVPEIGNDKAAYDRLPSGAQYMSGGVTYQKK